MEPAPSSRLPMFLSLCGAVIALWIATLYIASCSFPDWQTSGQFGDTFGALNTLFSGFAFAALIVTLLAQQAATKQQEIQHAQNIEIQRDQARLNEISGRIEALKIALEMANAKVKQLEPERNTFDRTKLRIAENHRDAILAELEFITVRSPNFGPQLFFSDEQIVEQLSRVPGISAESVRTDLGLVRQHLFLNGVVTLGKLEQLVTSNDILKAIAEMYVRVLQRPKESPLDPGAVAVWGGLLLSAGINSHALQHIENQLRKSPEYEEKVLSKYN